MIELKKRYVNYFYILTGLFWASVYTYQPTMSPYLKSIGVSYSMIGLIGGAYGLTQMILRIPLGMVSDRLGKRKIFIVSSVLIAALSSLMLYLATSPFVILLGRALAGVAASGWVIFTVLFASYFEKEKAASKISVLTMINSAGQVTAMLAGGITAAYLGYKFPFLLGAVVAAAGVIFSFLIKENVPETKNPPKLRELFEVAKDKNLIVMSSLAILAQIVLFGTMSTFTPMVGTNLGAGSTELGYLSSTVNIPRILSAMFCAIVLSRKIDVRKPLALGFLLLALGSALVPFVPNLGMLYVVSAISGFGSGVAFTTLLGLCTRSISQEKRSTAMGFFQAIYGIGLFAGPVASGVITDAYGLVWGFGFSAIVSVIGFAGTLIFVKN